MSGFSKSIGGGSGSRSINTHSQGLSRAKGLSGTRGAYEPVKSYGNGEPRQDGHEEQRGSASSPARFFKEK
jgi:hypothetical protein